MFDAPRVTLKQIAEQAGVSVAAVSMALRGHLRISAGQRERIQQIAADLGYHPDPALSALAQYRRTRQGGSRGWTAVAVLTDWRTADSWREYHFYRRFWEACRDEAARRGFALEHHWIGSDHQHQSRVLRELRNRGIRAVLLGPPQLNATPKLIPVPPPPFHTVAFAPASLYPDVHVVQTDYWGNFERIWQELRRADYRAPGLYLPQDVLWRVDKTWLAAFLMHQELEAREVRRVAPCLPDFHDRAKFVEWFEEEKPDAVIALHHEVAEWIKTRGFSLGREVGVALTSLSNGRAAGQAGIDMNPGLTAASAMDLLQTLLQQDLSGRVSPIFRVSIPGTWVPGRWVRRAPSRPRR